MKLILLLATLTYFTFAAIAQSGQTCNTAQQNYSKDTCAYQNWVISGTEYWFYFKANTPYVYISVITTKFGINAPHVHRVELYDGTCSNPVLIADDELPFVDYWDELRIDLDASGLIPGNKYYIRLSRLPSGGKLCDKSTCRAMIQPAGFDICIQDVNVFIPPDSSLEQPSIAHEYIQNKGQIIDVNGNPRPDIVLVAPNASPQVYVANNAAYFVFTNIDTSKITLDTLHRVDMTLVDANPNTRTFKTEQTPGRTHYYLPQTPNGVSAKGFSRLVWNEAYPEIDMQFYSNNEGLKMYFIARPGGDAENIKIKFDGATNLNITNYGGLEIITSIGKMQFDPGHAYQINPAGNIVPMPWQAKFLKASQNEVIFDIRNYAPNMPLIIQVDKGHTLETFFPIQNLEFSTYWGATSRDIFTDIISDASANMYFTGYTYNTFAFPSATGFYLDTSNAFGDPDIVCGKLNNICEPQWVLIYGGDTNALNQGGYGHDIPMAITINDFGQIYITGYTQSIDLPLIQGTAKYFDNINDCAGTVCWDIFILKINNQGIPVWASFYGADVNETASDIAIDVNNNVYIVGKGRENFTPLKNEPGASNFSYGNGLILKFNADDSLVWATLFGSERYETLENINSIYIDNNIYITGAAASPGVLQPLPIINPGVDSAFSGGNTDGFFAMFNSNDLLLTSTYLGGSGDDNAKCVTVDPYGNIYIGGSTISADFPTKNMGGVAYFVDTLTYMYNTYIDGFLMKLDNSGQLSHSTYWGGFSQDDILNITSDDNGIIYFGGLTYSDSSGIYYFVTIPFPDTNPSGVFIQKHMKGGPGFEPDAFISAITPAFKILYTSYYGGEGGDILNGIYSDNSKLYIAGSTKSYGFKIPLADFNPSSSTDYFQSALSNSSYEDGFMARFDLSPIISLNIDEYAPNIHSLYYYPNPSTGKIYIPVQIHSENKITIFDLFGRKIYSKKYPAKLADNIIELDLSYLPDGIFILRLEYGNETFTNKLIID